MDTLRGFVHAVWTTDPGVQHAEAAPGVWSKPDDVSGSYELRRLTTSQNRVGARTDFFELYWAHRMEGTTLAHLAAWGRRLVFRSPARVPRALRSAWWLVAVLLAVAAVFFVVTLLPEARRPFAIAPWLSGLLSAISALAVVPVARTFLGDAARYLDAAPPNIQRRQEIRAAGVKVLNALHASGAYDRIVVVGHSLGSVIGYDVLTHAWPAYAEQVDPTLPSPVLDEIEEVLQAEPFDPDAYRALQRRLFEELRDRRSKWLVTDFVTIGSPLAHAELLLADDAVDLERKQTERELPTCPPVLEDGRLSFAPNRRRLDRRRPHHAAVFGPTRWTNVYAPSSAIVRGDIIGGPLAPVFGRGVEDVPVAIALWNGLLSHTLYWMPEAPDDPGDHVVALREAIRLVDDPPPAL